jgi:hypothetical protein
MPDVASQSTASGTRTGGMAAVEPGPEWEPQAAPIELEFIFRAPIKLNKPGEFCEEYEQLRKSLSMYPRLVQNC